jgi:hypothetical protein
MQMVFFVTLPLTNGSVEANMKCPDQKLTCDLVLGGSLV